MASKPFSLVLLAICSLLSVLQLSHASALPEAQLRRLPEIRMPDNQAGDTQFGVLVVQSMSRDRIANVGWVDKNGDWTRAQSLAARMTGYTSASKGSRTIQFVSPTGPCDASYSSFQCSRTTTFSQHLRIKKNVIREDFWGLPQAVDGMERSIWADVPEDRREGMDKLRLVWVPMGQNPPPSRIERPKRSPNMPSRRMEGI